MCSVVPHPYGFAEAEFFVDHVCSRADGMLYAIVLGGRVVGCVGLEYISGESATLGYWLGADAWGAGVATEAAGALIDHAFGGLLDGLERIESGYWTENVASAKVQSKLGFGLLGRGPLRCLARDCELQQQYTRLTREEWLHRRVAPPPPMAAFELVASFPQGLPLGRLRAVCTSAADRAAFEGDEAAIEAVWRARRASQPSLFNGAKFRFAGVEAGGGEQAAAASGCEEGGGEGGEGGVETRGASVVLGLTDYRSFLGTNCAEGWRALPPACLASPLGNAAVVRTSDGRVVLLQRSGDVGECPDTYVMPGGHPEPEGVGVASLEEWRGARGAEARAASGWCESVARELYEAMTREVVEETGIPPGDLSPPLCLGFSRRVLHHRPDMVFLIECRLDSAAVAEAYRTAAGVHRDESTTIELVPQEELLRRALDEAALNMPGCHVGGLALFRKHREANARTGS